MPVNIKDNTDDLFLGLHNTPTVVPIAIANVNFLRTKTKSGSGVIGVSFLNIKIRKNSFVFNLNKSVFWATFLKN